MKVRMPGLHFSFNRCVTCALLITAISASAAVVDVSVVNNRFQPASVNIHVNDQVKWTWAAADGGVPHTTTSEQVGLWDSGIHTQPFDFTFTFQSAGTFPYVCTLHAGIGMTGTVTVEGTGNVPPVITNQPASRTVTEGDSVTFTVVATGTGPMTYQWRKGIANVPGGTNASLTLTAVTSADAGDYTVVVSNVAGSVISDTAVLTVNSGATAPVITTQPASQTVAPGATVTFTVVATGTAPLTYQWKKGIGDVPDANSASLTLTAVTSAEAGSYTVVVSNSAGSITSDAAVLTVNTGGTAPTIVMQPVGETVAVGSSVTFTIVANGTGPLSYQWKKAGVAIPGAMASSFTINNVQTNDAGTYMVTVSNAGGSVDSANALLTVQPGSTVTFAAGSYNGLFSNPDGVSPPSSGSISLKLTPAGKFTGKLARGGSRSSLSGQFDQAGHAHITQQPVTVDLQVSSEDPDRITGTISDGTFTADLLADRAGFDGRQNMAPQAGRYTIAIDGNEDGSTTTPGGYGFGTITVNSAGVIKLAATLADGTKLSQSVPLSKNGDWPLYGSLYGGRGSFMSWGKFAETETSDFSGDVVWIKPAVPAAKLYPAGFTFSTTMDGSRYQAGSKVLNFSNGQLTLERGGLVDEIVNQITLADRSRVTNLSSNKLSLTFSPSTGLFSGKVTDPSNSMQIPFKGAVLQKENVAFGWFPGRNNQSGEVTISGQ